MCRVKKMVGVPEDKDYRRYRLDCTGYKVAESVLSFNSIVQQVGQWDVPLDVEDLLKLSSHSQRLFGVKMDKHSWTYELTIVVNFIRFKKIKLKELVAM